MIFFDFFDFFQNSLCILPFLCLKGYRTKQTKSMKAPYSRVRTLFAAMLALAGTPLLYSQDAVAAVYSRGRQIPLDGNSALTVPLDALPLEIQVVKDGRVVSRCELNAAKSAKSERHYDLTLTMHETGGPFSVYSTPFLSGETVTGGFGGGSGEHFTCRASRGIPR